MHDKDMPIPPRVGLMDTHYCLLCGAYLAGDHIKRCPVCGQAVKWEELGCPSAAAELRKMQENINK